MSATGSSADLVTRWGITKRELLRRQNSHPEPTKPNERHCPHCGYRVTKTKSGREVGHANGRKKPMCPMHPDNDAKAQTEALSVDVRKSPLPSYGGDSLSTVKTEQATLGGDW